MYSGSTREQDVEHREGIRDVQKKRETLSINKQSRMRALLRSALLNKSDEAVFVEFEPSDDATVKNEVEGILCGRPGGRSCFGDELGARGVGAITFRSLFDNEGASVFGMVSKGRVVAVVCVDRYKKNDWYFRALCVDDTFRGRGIGTRLAREMQARFPHFWLTVWLGGDPARAQRLTRYYEGLGLRVTVKRDKAGYRWMRWSPTPRAQTPRDEPRRASRCRSVASSL